MMKNLEPIHGIWNVCVRDVVKMISYDPIKISKTKLRKLRIERKHRIKNKYHPTNPPPNKNGDELYLKLWNIIDGSIRDYTICHPELEIPIANRYSITKRIVGSINGFVRDRFISEQKVDWNH